MPRGSEHGSRARNDSRRADRMGGAVGEDAEGIQTREPRQERSVAYTLLSLSLIDTFISLRLFQDYVHRCREDAL
uniref:Transmembrane protein n=1 Tax=Haemonchus contortus TaxID=6289 RepID=A0A7I4Y3S8_HAECO